MRILWIIALLCLSVLSAQAFLASGTAGVSASSLTVDEFATGFASSQGIIINRQAGASGFTGRLVTLTGTYTGSAPTSFDCQTAYASGDTVGTPGTVVQGWTQLTSFSPSGGTWTGQLQINLSTDWIVAQCRDHYTPGTTSSFQSTKWGVGIIWAWIGQSNMSRAYQTGTTAVTSSARTKRMGAAGWNTVTGSLQGWEACCGISDKGRQFANAISTACNCLVGVLPYGNSGTAILQWISSANGGTTPNNVWDTYFNLNGSAQTLTITGISKANPAVVTAANTLVNGAMVGIAGVSGMTQVNNVSYQVAGVTGSSFQLVNPITGATIDSTGFGTYTSGGNAYPKVGIASPLLYGQDFEGAIWQQGENDIGSSAATYASRLTTLWNQLRTATGRNSTTFKFGVMPLGDVVPTVAAPSPNNAGIDSVRQGHLKFIDDNAGTGVFNAGVFVDLPHAPSGGGSPDDVHFSSADYAHYMIRATQGALAASGFEAHGVAGPKITAAQMAVGTTDVALTITQDGGTLMRDSSSNSSCPSLLGFRVFANSVQKTITSTSCSGTGATTTITLGTGYTRLGGDTITMDFGYGANPGGFDYNGTTVNTTNMPYDNFVPGVNTAYPDSLPGTPLQPTRGAMTVSP